MKRICKTMAALLLCMLLVPGAMAEGMLTPTPLPLLQPTPVPPTLQDRDVLSLLPENSNPDYHRLMRTAASVGDAVYILTYTSKEAQLWRWTADMYSAELVSSKLLYAPHHVHMSDARESAQAITGNPEDAAFAISTMFSDGETLYGYNGLNRTVFTIKDTGAGLECRTLVTLAKTVGDTGDLPFSVCVAGDWLLWADYDYRLGNYGDRLLAFNLETGAVKQAMLPETFKTISSYKDGKALVICASSQDVAERTVYAYDPAADTAEKLGSLPRGVNAHRVAYSQAMGMLAYQDRTRIMGWTPEGVEQIGYMPEGNNYAALYAAKDAVLYTGVNDQLMAANVRRGYVTGHSITLMGGTMYSVLSQFYNRYQDVPVYYAEQKNGETWQEILSRETEMPDLWLCTRPSSYAAAVEAGALMDLSGYPEIREYIDALYPAFRDLAVQNGGIYGVPVYAASYDGWFINKEVMNAMGLTQEDIPTTLEGMIAFAQHWNDHWAEKYPHYTLLNNTTDYRDRLYYAIESEWRQLCEKEGKDVVYDDPAYVALLEQLDGADYTKLDEALKQTDPEISEYKHALIWTGCKDVGNFDTYMEEYSDRIFLPMTLTADTPYVTMIQECRLWVVNARSENGEYCAALLAESVAKIDDKTAYTLRADKTEAVENEHFAQQLAYQLDYLARLEDAVEKSINKEAALYRVETQKAYIDSGMNGMRYLINPSAIENYRNVIAPAAYVSLGMPRTSNQLIDLERLEHMYLYREISAQELAEALAGMHE